MPRHASIAQCWRWQWPCPWRSLLDIQQRVPDVHLQHLALHFDRADEDPDLILRERSGSDAARSSSSSVIAACWSVATCSFRPVRFQASCSARWSRSTSRSSTVLVKQQAQPGHVLRRGVRLQLLDLLRQAPCTSSFCVWLVHGRDSVCLGGDFA